MDATASPAYAGVDTHKKTNMLALLDPLCRVIGTWEFPTGVIDGDESPEEAARRELMEETGLELVSVDRVLPPACYSVGITDELIVPVFVTVRGEMKPCDEAYEEIRSYKMSVKKIRELLNQDNVKITETCMLILSTL